MMKTFPTFAEQHENQLLNSALRPPPQPDIRVMFEQLPNSSDYCGFGVLPRTPLQLSHHPLRLTA